MGRVLSWRRSAMTMCIGLALAVRPSPAQEVAGITFDVSVTAEDSSGTAKQAGTGWIAGKRSRLDLRGPGSITQGMPGLPGQNISLIVEDSSGVAVVAVVDHDSKKVMYPSKMMEQVRQMMTMLPEQPRMTFKVANIKVDTLGAGETVSGFTTKRFRLQADVSVAISMMGENEEQTMHIETEGDYAEELSDFMDPLQGSRTFQAFTSGMPFLDSTATAELGKLAAIMPRGLPLRQTDRMTGVTEGGNEVEGSTTRLSNIKRQSFPVAVFAVPEGYTEMRMPMGADVNDVN